MKYFHLLQKKLNLASSRKKPHVPSDYNLQPPVDIQISNHMFKQKKDCKANRETGKCKIKRYSGRFRHIYAYFGIFRHIRTYPDIIRNIQAYSKLTPAYSEPCVTQYWRIKNSGILRILAYSKPEAYSEPWYLQNSDTFRTRDIFRILGTLRCPESETYSESCQTSIMERPEKQLTGIIILASYNYFCNIRFSFPLVHEIDVDFFQV